MIAGFQLNPHVHLYTVEVPDAAPADKKVAAPSLLDGCTGDVAIFCPATMLDVLHAGFLTNPKPCSVSVFTDSQHAGRDSFIPAGATVPYTDAFPPPPHFHRHPPTLPVGVNFKEVAAKVPRTSVFDVAVVVYTDSVRDPILDYYMQEFRALEALGITTMFVTTNEFREGFTTAFTRYEHHTTAWDANWRATPPPSFREFVFANANAAGDVSVVDVTVGAYHDPVSAMCHALYGAPPNKTTTRTQNVEIDIGAEILAAAPLDVGGGTSTMRVATNKIVLDVREGRRVHLVVVTAAAPTTQWPALAAKRGDGGVAFPGLAVSWPVVATDGATNVRAIDLPDFSRLATEYAALRRGNGEDDPIDAVTFFLREQYRVKCLLLAAETPPTNESSVSTLVAVYRDTLRHCVRDVRGFESSPKSMPLIARHASNW